MRLNKCHIKSFGRLKDQSFVFTDGLNRFIGENGSGKTTLSVFIKVMLYGMSDTKRTALSENDRKHYLPWDGGTASGSLEFSVGQRSYRVERSFGTKAGEDSFALYDLTTGRPSSDYGESLGKEILGIDADGFERTVFLSERGLGEAGKNQTVSAKLSGLVGCDGDIEGFDDAIKLLEEERKRYSKRGGTGEISELKHDIGVAEERLSELDAIEARLSGEKERLEENGKSILRAEEEIKRLERMKETLIERRAEGASRERIASLTALISQKEYELSQYSEMFRHGVPSFEQVSENSYKYSEARRVLAQENTDPEHERLKRKFENVTENDIERISAVIKEERASEKSGKQTVGRILISIFACLLILVGFVLKSSSNVYFYLLSAAGMLILGCSLLSGFVRKKRKSKREAELHSFVSVLPYRVCDGVLEEAELAVKEFSQYSSLSVFLRYKDSEEERKRERAVSQLAEAEKFLAKFGLYGDGAFDKLKTALGEYNRISSERQSAVSELKIFEAYTPHRDGISSEIGESELEAERSRLGEALRELRRETASSERTIQSLSASLEEREELISQREELMHRLAESEEKYRIIQLTKDLLGEARDLMSSKYLGRTKEGFSKYTRLINEQDRGIYEMNTDFSVARLEGGRARSAEGYSKGTRDLYNIAARLALVDSLYSQEAPPIILDDPFISLDDKKAKAAIRLLERLAENRQIIYFTCSESRG